MEASQDFVGVFNVDETSTFPGSFVRSGYCNGDGIQMTGVPGQRQHRWGDHGCGICDA